MTSPPAAPRKSATRGVEWDPAVLTRGEARVAAEPPAVARRVALSLGDAAAAHAAAARATVVFAYLVPAGLAAVEAMLAGVVERGGRVVCNMFRVPGRAERGWLRETAAADSGLPVYLYALPDGPAAGS